MAVRRAAPASALTAASSQATCKLDDDLCSQYAVCMWMCVLDGCVDIYLTHTFVSILWHSTVASHVTIRAECYSHKPFGGGA